MRAEQKDGNKKLNVFAHAYMLPENSCQYGCRTRALVAISEDGAEFHFEVDQSRYNESGYEMWDAFCNYCKALGLNPRNGDMWFSISQDKVLSSDILPCKPCEGIHCFNLSDNMEYLSCWNLKRMEQEYESGSIHLKNPLSFAAFMAESGYDEANEPYAGRDLYRKYKEEIDKDSFSEEECARMVKFIAEHTHLACGVSTAAEEQKLIVALLRLSRDAPELYEKSLELIFEKHKGTDSEEKLLLCDFITWLYYEYSECAWNRKALEADLLCRKSELLRRAGSDISQRMQAAKLCSETDDLQRLSKWIEEQLYETERFLGKEKRESTK